MLLTELLKTANIKLDIDAKTKAEAIAQLVNLLKDNGEIADATKVLDSVLEREATRTTGIGAGLAIPHGKCFGATHLTMALGRARTPVDFQSIDGRPVTWIWLLTSPPDKTGPHIQALARISRLMMVDKFRQALGGAQSAEQVHAIIAEQEAKL